VLIATGWGYRISPDWLGVAGIGWEWIDRVFDQQRGSARFHHTIGHFGDLQVRTERLHDPTQLTLGFENL
jgi:hypothetical protein